ncbi:MAG TPA: C4-type zinc ribbon domain-containing protein [Actinomycetota bacterium]|nr:C4-type zinc ribbon domain-containing protein [Actinomycetota bacterium]
MPEQVDDAILLRLLDLQKEDSSIRRLAERRASLPEAQELVELRDQLAELDSDIAIARKQSEEIATEQARIEGEIGLLDTKIQREEQRMYSGGVSNPKELSALQAEVESLKRKKGQMEDGLLEVMVQKDDAATTLTRLESEQAESLAREKELAVVVDGLTADIDAQLVEHTARRSQIAQEMPADLLALYDQLRESKHGVGAAALQSGACQGCHTQLPAKEVERLKTERGLQRCDNCRRILVVL